MQMHPRDEFIPDVFANDLLQVVLKFREFKSIKVSDPFFLFSFSHLSIRNRVGTGRTKELLIIRNLRNIYSFLQVSKRIEKSSKISFCYI